MANWDNLKAAIQDVIKENGNEEITGQVLQNTLLSIVNNLGENATFVGVATPETNPGAPDGPVFYFAFSNGLYSNFGGLFINKIDNVKIFKWNGSNWDSIDTGLPNNTKVTELVTEISNELLSEVDKKVQELSDKVDNQKNEVNTARDEAIQAINSEEQSAISNFNAQRVTPEMLSESTLQLINSSGGGTVTNLADDEDLYSTGGDTRVLKFKDKDYIPENFSGLGRVFLRKNIQLDKNILLQNMISKPNTRYIIQYDYDLNGAEITIPEGCILQFDGGTLKNGKVNFNNCIIKGVNGINSDVKCSGFKDAYVYFDWFINEQINYNDYNSYINSNNSTYGSIPYCTGFNNIIINNLEDKYKFIEFGPAIYIFNNAVDFTGISGIKGVNKHKTLLFNPTYDGNFITFKNSLSNLEISKLTVESKGTCFAFTGLNHGPKVYEVNLNSFTDHACIFSITSGITNVLYGGDFKDMAVVAGTDKSAFYNFTSNSNKWTRVNDLHYFFNGMGINHKNDRDIMLSFFYNCSFTWREFNVTYFGFKYAAYYDSGNAYRLYFADGTLEATDRTINKIVYCNSAVNNNTFIFRNINIIGSNAELNRYYLHLQGSNWIINSDTSMTIISFGAVILNTGFNPGSSINYIYNVNSRQFYISYPNKVQAVNKIFSYSNTVDAFKEQYDISDFLDYISENYNTPNYIGIACGIDYVSEIPTLGNIKYTESNQNFLPGKKLIVDDLEKVLKYSIGNKLYTLVPVRSTTNGAYVAKSKDELDNIYSEGSPNIIIFVTDIIDLEGTTFNCRANYTFIFLGGQINNGIINTQGNATFFNFQGTATFTTNYNKQCNTTNSRPNSNLVPGLMYFDTTINKPIWWIGSKWVDATGADV